MCVPLVLGDLRCHHKCRDDAATLIGVGMKRALETRRDPRGLNRIVNASRRQPTKGF